MNRLLVLLLCSLTSVAFATGNDKPDNSNGPTQVHTNVNVHPKVDVRTGPTSSKSSSSSTSGAIAGSKSSSVAKTGDSKSTSNARTGDSTSKATGGNARGGKSDATVIDDSSFVDASVYEAEKQAAASAASLPEMYCGGSGLSAQTRAGGVSLTDTDNFCKRMALAASRRETGLALLEAAESLRAASTKTPGGNPLAAELQVRGLKMLVEADAQETKAAARLDEDQTAVRSFFVKTLGSLPILHFIAPR